MTRMFGKDIYAIGLAAGITGGLWSRAIEILDKFHKELEKKNMISRKNYKKYLIRWISVWILSAICSSIMLQFVH